MLVRFVVSNYLSFGEETEFNMLTGAPRRFKEHVYQYGDLELLKTAAIYGPNGAGKSNLVKAIALLKDIVTGEEGVDQYSFEPFRLKTGMDKEPTHLEAEFISEDIVYNYGLEILNHKIKEEWLYRTGKVKDELVFKRTTQDGITKIEANKHLLENEEGRLRFKLYEEELLPDTKPLLGMLAGAKRVFDDVKKSYSWFDEKLMILDPSTMADGLSLQYHTTPVFKNFVDTLLPSLKTGITKLDMVSVEIDRYFGEDDWEQSEDIKRTLRNGKAEYGVVKDKNSDHAAIAVKEGDKIVVKRLITTHEDQEGKIYSFEIKEESDGTQRVLDFVPALFDIINNNETLIIDEINQSIHPYLLKELVAKFVNDPNTLGQLIFTTHESNLLDQEIFRQDEIWFAEKKPSGETAFYPLSDFDIRYDLDIRKGYLNGRFGAIPFLGNFKDLKWDKYGADKQAV
ncbi:MAG: ATP/GTP-binding protein [Saprospiraceae bacterium]|nr:ATP/GTP-binding protein [Saprospiraceae bacterium]